MAYNPFKKKAANLPPTRKRLQRLTLPEVYDWSEACLINTGWAFAAWRKGGGEPALDDARKQIEALLEICEELRSRDRLRT